MKTMHFFVNLLLVSVFSLPLLTAQNNDKELLTISEIKLKQGRNTEFIDGVKNGKQVIRKIKALPIGHDHKFQKSKT